jgi:hypothetical protein
MGSARKQTARPIQSPTRFVDGRLGGAFAESTEWHVARPSGGEEGMRWVVRRLHRVTSRNAIHCVVDAHERAADTDAECDDDPLTFAFDILNGGLRATHTISCERAHRAKSSTSYLFHDKKASGACSYLDLDHLDLLVAFLPFHFTSSASLTSLSFIFLHTYLSPPPCPTLSALPTATSLSQTVR